MVGPGPLRDAIVMFMFVSAASRAALARGDGLNGAWEEKLAGVDPRAALYTGAPPCYVCTGPCSPVPKRWAHPPRCSNSSSSSKQQLQQKSWISDQKS